jgi:hypothetical protein
VGVVLTKDHDGDGYTLSSGRRLYANRGIVGINPEMEVYEGYDGKIYTTIYTRPLFPGEISGWSHEEKCELADFMISLWTKFKASE